MIFLALSKQHWRQKLPPRSPAVTSPAFPKVICGDSVIDLLDFGKVIASNCGEEPTEEVLTFLRDKSDLPV